MFRYVWAAVLVTLLSFAFLHEANAKVDLQKTEFHSVGFLRTGEKVHFLRYYEEKTWYVQQLKENKNGWLDLVVQETYASASAAQAAQSRLEKKFGAGVREFTSAGLQVASLTSEVPDQVIWPTTQSWSWEWEQKYAQWLTENMTTDFFAKYKVATDCADVAYAARWIFARIHGLPAANRLGNSVLFSNLSLREEWAGLPTAEEWHQDQRFRKALNYVLNFTYTHTLMRDSYPVAITPENFLEGVHILNLGDRSGHTQLVHKVEVADPAAIPYMIIQSTVPREVRHLNESLYWNSQQAKKEFGGFLRIRWPLLKDGQYVLANPTDMPGYSLEQYDPKFIREEGRGMNIEVMLRLNPKVNFLYIFEQGLNNLKVAFQERVQIVNEGFQNCKDGQCPEGSAGYENWSTPARDHKIVDMLSQVSALTNIRDSNNLQGRYLEELNKTYLQLNNESYSLRAISHVFSASMISSDPAVEPALRWALEPSAYLAKTKEKIEPELVKRAEKISAKHDEELRNLSGRSLFYCSNFSAQQCATYNEELKKPVSWLGQQKSAQEWFEAIRWFNSDPAQSKANQWGDLRFQYSSLDLIWNRRFTITAEGLAALEVEENKLQIGPMTQKGVQNQPLPDGFIWKGFEKNSSIAFAFAPGRALHFNFKTGKQTESELPLRSVERVRVISAQRLLVLNPDQLVVLKVFRGKISVEWQQAISQKPKLQIGNIVTVPQGDETQIFDFNLAEPKVTVAKRATSALVGFNQKYFVFFDNMVGMKIHRETGEATPIDVQNFMLSSKNFQQVLTMVPQTQKAILLTMDENYAITHREEIGDYHGYWDNRISVKNGDKVFILAIDEDKLQKYSLLDDEVQLMNVSGAWMTVMKKDGQFRLRTLDGKTIAHEGELLVRVSSQTGAKYAFKAGPEYSQYLVKLEATKAPALYTGRFYSPGQSRFEAEPRFEIERGLLLAGSGGLVWIDFN